MSAEQLNPYDGFSALARDVQEERAVRTLARRLGLIVLRKEDVTIIGAEYHVDRHTLAELGREGQEAADKFMGLLKRRMDAQLVGAILQPETEGVIDRTFTLQGEDATAPIILHHEIAIINPRSRT